MYMLRIKFLLLLANDRGTGRTLLTAKCPATGDSPFIKCPGFARWGMLAARPVAGNFLSNFSFYEQLFGSRAAFFPARIFSYFGQYFSFLSVFIVTAREKIQCNCLTAFFGG